MDDDNDRLNHQQRLFMRAIQDAIADSQSPVSVDQIRIHFKKSDSRVRSHIKVLMQKGYVCCVGKSRVKRYVPSMLWLEEIDADERLDEIELPCTGGYCSTMGCNNLAEDYWRDGYYCRRCIIGHDDESDAKDVRERFLLQIAPQSSAGYLLDRVWPTYDEDVLESEEKSVPKKRRKAKG